MIKDIIEQAEALEQRIHTLSLTKEEMEANAEEIRRLDQERTQLLAQCADLSAADRVYLARHPKRPHIDDFIELSSPTSSSRRGIISMMRMRPSMVASPATRACR